MSHVAVRYYPPPDLARLSPPRGLGDKLGSKYQGLSRRQSVACISDPGEHRDTDSGDVKHDSDSSDPGGDNTDDDYNEYANITTLHQQTPDKTSDLGENISEVSCDDSELDPPPVTHIHASDDVDKSNNEKDELLDESFNRDELIENQQTPIFCEDKIEEGNY